MDAFFTPLPIELNSAATRAAPAMGRPHKPRRQFINRRPREAFFHKPPRGINNIADHLRWYRRFLELAKNGKVIDISVGTEFQMITMEFESHDADGNGG
jgi:hypothetical protein